MKQIACPKCTYPIEDMKCQNCGYIFPIKEIVKKYENTKKNKKVN
jgi:ribosomal protein L37E